MSNNDNDRDRRSRGDVARENKAEEKRLAELTTALIGLSSKQLGKLGLDEEVLGAVNEARRMTTHGARARQMRIVRRALRGSDNVAIGEAVHNLINPHGRPSPSARAAQGWVDRFLDEGNDAVEDFLASHETADRQHLKGLLRNVRKADASKVAKTRKSLVATIQAYIQEADS